MTSIAGSMFDRATFNRFSANPARVEVVAIGLVGIVECIGVFPVWYIVCSCCGHTDDVAALIADLGELERIASMFPG